MILYLIRMKGRELDRILSSPYVRCLQTVESKEPKGATSVLELGANIRELERLPPPS